jgi:hypothetical protein
MFFSHAGVAVGELRSDHAHRNATLSLADHRQTAAGSGDEASD